MSFSVHVTNFQSLLDVTLEVKGFTVITGTNNAGKSAVVRAIRSCFQNARGTSFIRHGKNKTSVEVMFNDGRKIRWEKGKGAGDKPTYVIDGGNPIHPGQGVPDEVRAFDVRPIQIAGREVWPQFAPQFTGQVFLLDQPGSVLAEAVADVNHVSLLNEALRLAESDKRSASSELKVRLADQSRLEEAAKQFEGLDTVERQVASLEADFAKATKMGQLAQVLEGLSDRLVVAYKGVADLVGVEGIGVPGDDLFTACTGILGELESVRVLGARRDATLEVLRALQGVALVDIPEAGDVHDVTQALESRDALAQLRARWEAAQALLGDLGGLPDIGDLGSEHLEEAHREVEALRALNSRWDKAEGVVVSLSTEVALAEKDLDVIVADIHGMLDGLGECPLCGAAQKADG